MVRTDRRPDIERYCKTHNIKDIHFIYCDIPKRMNFYYYRKQKGKNAVLDFLLYQYLWQYPAYIAAKKVHKQVGFDIVHHVSTNDFRLIGKLHRLGIPYILGPVGGAQETPIALQSYTKAHKKSEWLRGMLNRILTSFPGYKKALNSAVKIYFSNPETALYLKTKIKDLSKCCLLTEIAYTGMQMDEIPLTHKNTGDQIVFLWSGRMEYRKGLEFLFDILSTLPEGLHWQIILCGDGSERQYYQNLCREKGLWKRVLFKGKLSYEEMQNMYNKADVFVFPSLRETTGTVIVEAMAHRLPVICLNQSGAALVVTTETGFLVSGDTREDYIKNFAEAMTLCIQNKDLVKMKGQLAAKRVKEAYTWEKKVSDMAEEYSVIIKETGNAGNT